LFGVGLGAWFMNNMESTHTARIYELFENYLSLLHRDGQAFHQVLYSCFISGFRYFSIIAILGFLIVGIPILIGGILYKGFCTGFALACLLTVYGLESPIHLWIQILWQNLLLMPCILLFSCQSLAFSSKMIRAIKRDKRMVSFDFRRDSLLFVLQYLGFLIILVLLSFIGAGVCTLVI
jgi:stage II sporulation protein M